MEWMPATREDVQEALRRDWTRADPLLQSKLGRYLVESSPALLMRFGREEHVFIVARGARFVVFFDDVEDEFGIAEEVDGHLSDISFCGELMFALQEIHRREGGERDLKP
jgi:hypothetical protein